MISREGINGYSQTDVDAVINQSEGRLEDRWRAEVYNHAGDFIRRLKGFQTNQGSITLASQADVHRFGTIYVKEIDVDLPIYPTLITNRSNLLAYYRHGEASGTTMTDSSGNGRDGTYSASGVTYSKAPVPPGVTDNTGIQFDGTSSFGSIADAGWMDVTTGIGLDFWILGTNVSKAIIYRDDNSANRMWGVEINASGQVVFTITFTSGSPATKSFTLPPIISDGKPHYGHVGYSKTLGHVRGYMDSLLVLDEAETRTMATGVLAIRIGAKNNDSAFSNNTHDETAIYSDLLSGPEVRENWQRGSGEMNEILYNRRDRIKVFYAYKMPTTGTDGTPWAEVSKGYFYIEALKREASKAGVVRPVNLASFEWLLSKAETADTLTFPASTTNYITKVVELIELAGIDTSDWDITTTTETLAAELVVQPGTNLLEVIKGLLLSINYDMPRDDENGRGRLAPRESVVAREPSWTYRLNEESIVSADMTITEEYLDVGNEVPLNPTNLASAEVFKSATATNTNFNVASSVERIGFALTVFPPLKTSKFFHPNDDPANDDAAIRLLEERTLRQLAFDIETGPNAFHEIEDIVYIRHDEALNNPNIPQTKCVVLSQVQAIGGEQRIQLSEVANIE